MAGVGALSGRSFAKRHSGLILRQMVFKQTIEEDIVGSTGVVKGGSAPPLRLIEGRRAASERRVIGESEEGDEERRLAA